MKLEQASPEPHLGLRLPKSLAARQIRDKNDRRRRRASAQIKFHRRHPCTPLRACRRRERDSSALRVTQVAPAKPPKKKTAQEKRRDFDRQRDCEKCQRTCMDCIYLPFFLCASCCCRSWVAKKRKEGSTPRRRNTASAEPRAEGRGRGQGGRGEFVPGSTGVFRDCNRRPAEPRGAHKQQRDDARQHPPVG